jgi:D-beta-D-heptose 7-phosphate kinase/D-beta-D-heptose 1-phosphate adenosyltransferase
MRKIVLVTGGFDPIHSGHIAYLQAAKQLGDVLIVGVNSDEWLTRKKGKPFLPWEERATIVSGLKDVTRVINFDDSDGSAKDAIRKLRAIYPNQMIVFANGGDRTKDNIPEMDLLNEYLHLTFVFGVGGENKANSSSWILEEWKNPKTIRPWGYYRVLHTYGNTVKVKELTVDPGKSLSMQRHANRTELWFVAEGTAGLNWDFGGETVKKFKQETILAGEWHQLHNPSSEPLHVIEIQYGTDCVEEDIERK